MSQLKLDQDEAELLHDLESDDFKSVLTSERRAELSAAAERTVRKDKRINIRISARDLEAIQRRALQEGMPYQTLVASVLHKYVSGGLTDVVASKVREPAGKYNKKKV